MLIWQIDVTGVVAMAGVVNTSGMKVIVSIENGASSEPLPVDSSGNFSTVLTGAFPKGVYKLSAQLFTTSWDGSLTPSGGPKTTSVEFTTDVEWKLPTLTAKALSCVAEDGTGGEIEFTIDNPAGARNEYIFGVNGVQYGGGMVSAPSVLTMNTQRLGASTKVGINTVDLYGSPITGDDSTVVLVSTEVTVEKCSTMPTPTASPTSTPTASPTATPASTPTATPTAQPTAEPTASPAPSASVPVPSASVHVPNASTSAPARVLAETGADGAVALGFGAVATLLLAIGGVALYRTRKQGNLN